MAGDMVASRKRQFHWRVDYSALLEPASQARFHLHRRCQEPSRVESVRLSVRGTEYPVGPEREPLISTCKTHSDNMYAEVIWRPTAGRSRVYLLSR